MMSALPSPALLARVSFDQAVDVAVRILEACGLSTTHGIAAIYGAGDFRAEGAAFAVTIHPRAKAKTAGAAEQRPAGADRGSLKLLIQNDGQTSLRALPKRRPRRETKGASAPAAPSRF